MMVEHTDPFYLEIGKTIKESGRQIIGIGPEKKKPGFYYTIGNHLKSAPEFLMIGNIEPVMAQMIMNMISDLAIRQKGSFASGHKFRLHKQGHPVQIWNTTIVAKLEYTRQATEYFQHGDYAVQQIVLPDEKGRFPGEHNCSTKYRVPVLKATTEIMSSISLH